jgi:hypothetical protein
MPAPLICLITPGHLSSTPRILKEADALAAAGYRVHVVSGRHYAPVDPLDADILATVRWTGTRVDYRRGAGSFLRKVQRKGARFLLTRSGSTSPRVAAIAHHAESLHLASVAARVRADFYLGHCLAALPAAALAARHCGVPCGFDIEDFHDAETANASADPAEAQAIRLLQQSYLPACRHLTAAAPLIASAVNDRYGVTPEVLLNVFPLAQAPAAPFVPEPISESRPARLYWFSQTIGPGRGLEQVIEIAGRMQTPVEVQLRGFVAPDYAATLQAAARHAGMKRPVQLLPPGPAAEMARLAATADLGLSTETPPPLNRDLCLTNKVFVYLLAGLPQLLSRTTAQAALAPALGAAGVLAELQNPTAVARQLDEFFADPSRIAAARNAAWTLARSRYCWDVEQLKFLASIARVVGAPGSPAPQP